MRFASAEAQQPKKVPRIGYVSGSGDPSTPAPDLRALRKGLQDLGYTEGKNILVEIRCIEGKIDRISSLVAVYPTAIMSKCECRTGIDTKEAASVWVCTTIKVKIGNSSLNWLS